MSRNLDTASAALLIGLLCLPLSVKVNPGGPFISLLGDAVPFGLAVLAYWCALPFLTSEFSKVKISAIAHMVLAAILLVLVVWSVADFYLSPYSRGSMIGW